MARELGDERFGVFFFGLAISTLVTTFASFGFETVLTREVARDHARLHEYFANTIWLQLALGVPVLLVLAVGGGLVGFDRETWAVVALLGVAVIAESLMQTVFAVNQAWERLGSIPIVLISQRWLTAAVGITALALGAGVVVIAAIYLAGAVLALLLSYGLLVSQIVRPRLQLDSARRRSILRTAAPVGVAGVLATLMFRADTPIIAGFDGNDDVGQYGAAFRLLESTLVISWSAAAALYPVFSRRAQSPGFPVAPVFEGGLKLVLVAALPVAAGAAVLADPVVELIYGPGFEQGAAVLALLAPAILAHPVAFLAEHLLISHDRQRALLTAYAALTVVTITAYLIAIALFSITGAAVVTSAVEVTIAAVLLALSLRVTGPLNWRRITFGPLLAAGLAATAMYLARDNLVAATILGVASYLAALLVFESRVFPADVRQLRDSLGRRAG